MLEERSVDVGGISIELMKHWLVIGRRFHESSIRQGAQMNTA
jgi:hypothetical protein